MLRQHLLVQLQIGAPPLLHRSLTACNLPHSSIWNSRRVACNLQTRDSQAGNFSWFLLPVSSDDGQHTQPTNHSDLTIFYIQRLGTILLPPWYSGQPRHTKPQRRRKGTHTLLWWYSTHWDLSQSQSLTWRTLRWDGAFRTVSGWTRRWHNRWRNLEYNGGTMLEFQMFVGWNIFRGKSLGPCLGHRKRSMMIKGRKQVGKRCDMDQGCRESFFFLGLK